MSAKLPLIVGFGGFNAAGRSSGHRGYMRTIYESLDQNNRDIVINSLSSLMGLPEVSEKAALDGSLIRRIDSSLFDVDNTSTAQNVYLRGSEATPISFSLSRRQMPENIPSNWTVEPTDESGRTFKVNIACDIPVRIDTTSEMSVKAAGQLPTGFDPGSFYRSQHHPRGLQMSVLAASDAVKSVGISWSDIINTVSPDDVSVYSSSIMSQLDHSGTGGMMSARNMGQRVSSKQLAMGFNSMPADFTNAYVLGNLGATGAVTGACATFLYNLRWAVEEIRLGRKKVAMVGVSEAPIVPEVLDGYAAMSALATDDDLRKLDNTSTPDYRRASRPFGNNCGFTLAESSQYIVLMADDLAVELGANIYGAVPGVFVNADGFKKSISAPGAGNYITMAKAVGLARTLVGDKAVKEQSFIQAHGSSTPQNRTTESKIFHEVAQAFGISNWPVAAVKSYVGHSLGPASGDQLASTLGIFAHGILPGIKTIDNVADDVFAQHLNISNEDQFLGTENVNVSFLNSKGFGGNNASATILSPAIVDQYLARNYSNSAIKHYHHKLEATQEHVDNYLTDADNGKLDPIYEFGKNIVEEDGIKISQESIDIPGFKHSISLNGNEGFDKF